MLCTWGNRIQDFVFARNEVFAQGPYWCGVFFCFLFFFEKILNTLFETDLSCPSLPILVVSLFVAVLRSVTSRISSLVPHSLLCSTSSFSLLLKAFRL